MIDPSSIDIYALPWLPMKVHSTFPKATAIYFAIDSEDRLQYIGKTLNLKQRWKQHHIHQELLDLQVNKIAFYFPDFSSTEVKEDQLKELEAKFIAWLKPPVNKRCPKLPKERGKFRTVEELFKESPIWKCVDSRVYHANSPQVKKFYSWAVENKHEIENVTNLTVSPKPIRALHKFLDLLEYKAERVGYFTIAGQQKYHYKIVDPDLPSLEAINSTNVAES